jgi:hypothetical protein
LIMSLILNSELYVVLLFILTILYGIYILVKGAKQTRNKKSVQATQNSRN